MIDVVLIEDDPMVQEVNRQFVSMVEGFQVTGIASNGKEGMKLIKSKRPTLVLIDVYMPHLNGLETMTLLRAEQISVDVIAITAASDIETVKAFLQNGAFDYIMKPFKFDRLKKALENYRNYYEKINRLENVSQKELDALLYTIPQENSAPNQLPKGLHEVTLKKIYAHLKNTKAPLSAEEVADEIGIARVTARRYLEYLEGSGQVILDVTYGGIGRPINRYIIKE